MRNSTRYLVRQVLSLLLLLGCFCHSFGQGPSPLIHLQFNETSGASVANTGTVSATFTRSTPTPSSSTNVPASVGGARSIDFGTTIGNYYVESTGVIDPLKNLNAFTLTGWINNRASVAGSGGNRIISWINNGGDGVDLVYQSNGSLRLGVDGWPDSSPAFSSANKVPTNAAAPASNWTFFAVTYQSNGQVSFYFGNNTTDATLDITRTYSGPGVTGSNINRLAIGAFNIGARNAGTYDRMYRGLIDNIQIHGSALSLSDIIAIQRPQVTPPSTSPLVVLPFNEAGPTTTAANTGSIGGGLVRSANVPTSTSNVPAGVGGANAIDFGTTPGNNFVQSSGVYDQLKNLSGFTLTGWVNNRSSTAGSGGNRIISWINNGGEGVDLVYQSNGSLRLGVDGWPDSSPAFSSAGKVPTNASAPSSNWTFFAVTYQSNGQVQFYFGNNTADATLDVTRSYPGPGVTGSNIGKLAIGAFNDATRSPGTYDRMFRGLIDDIQIYNSVLSLTDIRTVQRGSATTDTTPPSAPGNLASTAKTPSSISLSWTASTDNAGVTSYELYNSASLLASIAAPATSYTVNGLTANTTYNLTLKAKDAANNLSNASNQVTVTTDPPVPYLRATFDTWSETDIYSFNEEEVNTGTGGGTIYTAEGKSSNVPGNVGRPLSLASNGSFGTPDNLAGLKNLNAFAITGWLNLKTNETSPGGNVIVSWLNSAGTDGVELVYQSDGSLRLGVDGFASSSPAVSQPNKIHVHGSAPASNWVFFAVTYSAAGQAQFYFGDFISDATPDVTRAYPGPGVTGSNINPSMSIGPNQYPYPVLMDEIHVYTSTLNLTDIIAAQWGLADTQPPTAPANLTAVAEANAFVTLNWTPSTDNAGVISYELYDGGALIAVIHPGSTSYRAQLNPATSYTLTLRARDKRDVSAPSNSVNVTTGAGPIEPLVYVPVPSAYIFENNEGILGGQMVTSGTSPNAPEGKGPLSLGVNGNANSNEKLSLRNLKEFTITGWINRTSSDGGPIISWGGIGGDGAELIHQSDGSLRLGVDYTANASPAFSSPNKIPTDASASSSNWVFFAVTYRADPALVEYYFGSNTADASLDVTKNYPGQWITGPVPNRFRIGSTTALVDDIKVFQYALSLPEIIAAQQSPEDSVPPTAPDELEATDVTATTIDLFWGVTSSDNIGVTSYELYDGSTLLKSHVPNPRLLDYNNMKVTDLTPNTTYTLTLRAKDARGNLSDPSNTLIVTTDPLPAPTQPLVYLRLHDPAGVGPTNFGSAPANFVRSATTPSSSLNVPAGVGGTASVDFGTVYGDYFIESTAPIDALKNMGAFTLTGWVNNRSNVTGSGGNRIISWINNGGDGVDLVYESNGGLRLGIDGWPDNSPAVSSSGKIPTDPNASASNWTFFAVTYQANGQVQFYFGNNTADASLDVSPMYPGPFTTGANIGKLAIGAFNDAARYPTGQNRMFRGLIDEIYIYGSVLTAQEIVQVQRGTMSGGGGYSNVAQLESSTGIMDETETRAQLYQNFPNPYSANTQIDVSLPQNAGVVRIAVTDVTGRSLRNLEVVERGRTSVTLDGNDLNAGMYFYSLIVDGKVVDVKRMVLKK